MNTLAERLSYALERRNMDQADLARAVEVSPTTITKIMSGETKRSRKLPEIAAVLRISEQWLLFGDESNVTEERIPVAEWDSDTALPDDMVEVPFLKNQSLSAGMGAINDDSSYTGAKLWYSRSFIKRKGACPETVFCISIRGDSMSPVFDEGGIVMINTLDKNIIDGKPYAITHQGHDYIKYLQRMPNDQIRVVSGNPAYPTFLTDLKDVEIIGRVIEYSKEW